MEIWDGWFLYATLKDNTFLDVSLKSGEIPHSLFKTKKKDWNIHIVKNIKGKEYMTSSVKYFNLFEMVVKTNTGSIYKLGNPENNNQLKKIIHYFNHNDVL
tara:strand:+ start:1278 stop:1580 length:303 start_codon:yes stop_codon:yes gene_type:complete